MVRFGLQKSSGDGDLLRALLGAGYSVSSG
jgi:hypothetical protein